MVIEGYRTLRRLPRQVKWMYRHVKLMYLHAISNNSRLDYKQGKYRQRGLERGLVHIEKYYDIYVAT